MYDINKRKELKNAKIKDILEILKELPEDAEVYFNGDNYGYIHIEKDSSVISFDDSDLYDEYYYDGQIKDDDLDEKQSEYKEFMERMKRMYENA